MALQNPPVARTHMLIRKPVAVVFEAFTDPAITAKFWFTRGSGHLEQDSEVTWFWDMYAASAQVAVKTIENNKRIVVEWPTPVEWVFDPKSDDTTFVIITASGFTGTEDEQVANAIDSMGGFNLVLAACKAFLEYGVELNVVADHNPDAHVKKGA